MTWKLYALGSGGAFAVTYLVSLTQPFGLVRTEPTPQPAAATQSGAPVDLSATADRLRVRVAEATTHQAPVRNAFRFGEPRPVPVARPPVAAEVAPPVVAPARAPYAMAGVATAVEAGQTVRTAILTSLAGVTLVKDGDMLDGAYRVVSVTDETVELESIGEGIRTTLRLADSN
jgi:hypothetical protein